MRDSSSYSRLLPALSDLRQHPGHGLLGVPVVLTSWSPGISQGGDQARSLRKEHQLSGFIRGPATFTKVIPLRSNLAISALSLLCIKRQFELNLRSTLFSIYKTCLSVQSVC